ncbi:MAG: hypothetical protein NC300_04160 [Bacteroidales bacterium]|nr:hypothetical protein [Clostridium sp.]MCM1203316.1 hypothetical protein [Bacteroidales bacterium]
MELVIQALNEEFEVIHIRQMQQGHEILRCRQGDKEEYTLLHFRGEQEVKKLLPLFFALKENRVFEDYRGSFTQKGELYVVFYRQQGKPLSQLLAQEETDLEQRIAIGRRILEKVLLWTLPDFLVCQMLQPDRILVNNGEIAFDYEWETIGDTEAGQSGVNRETARLLRTLFRRETEQGISRMLLKLIEDLEKNIPEDFFAIYEAYTAVYDAMPKEAEEYESGILRMKNRFLQGLGHAADILKLLLLFTAYLLLVAVLVKEIRNKEEEGQEEQGIVFEYIGTLKIE